MISKKIHYCWFGGAEMSPFIKKCIDTWKKYLPDYELVLWNEEKFDVNSVPFVKEAYISKKWAFVADYVRFYALYTEGGLYLDTDVKVLKPFKKEWLNYSFFSAHEVHPDQIIEGELDSNFLPTNKNKKVSGISILSAMMGAQSGHKFIKECLDEYNNMKFLDQFGKMLEIQEVIIGQVLARVAINYGYKFNDVKMIINEDMLILPSNVLVGNSIHLNKESYAIHLANGSWYENENRDFIERQMYILRNNYPLVYPIFNIINKVRLKIIRLIGEINGG